MRGLAGVFVNIPKSEEHIAFSGCPGPDFPPMSNSSSIYIYIFIYFLTHQVIEKLLKVHLEIKNVQDEYIRSTHLSDFLFLRLCINKLVLK